MGGMLQQDQSSCPQIFWLALYTEKTSECFVPRTHHPLSSMFWQNWRSVTTTEKQKQTTPPNPSVTSLHTLKLHHHHRGCQLPSFSFCGWAPLDSNWPERVGACSCVLSILNLFQWGKEHWNLIWLLHRWAADRRTQGLLRDHALTSSEECKARCVKADRKFWCCSRKIMERFSFTFIFYEFPHRQHWTYSNDHEIMQLRMPTYFRLF